jgi:heme exporter protein B
MAVFALLVVALLSIVLPASPAERLAWSPALLWVVLLFTSLLGLARSFQSETEGGAFALLVQVPVDRGWVFLGKAGANALALIGVELWTGLLFTIFLDMDWSRAWPAALGAGLLGALGLAALGTLLSAMSVAVRFREFLLPVLLFPLVLPVLVLPRASRCRCRARVPALWWACRALRLVFVSLGTLSSTTCWRTESWSRRSSRSPSCWPRAGSSGSRATSRRAPAARTASARLRWP